MGGEPGGAGHGPWWRRLRPGPVLVAVVVLLAAEVGARALEPHLPPVPRWPEPVSEVKARQMAAIAARGEAIDVAFVGSSVVHTGIDVERFLDASTEVDSAYNAALNGLSPSGARPYVTDIVVPTTCARVVVIGVGPVELNDVGVGFANDRYLASRGFREASGRASLGDRFSSFAEDWSALARIRTHLRNPKAAYDQVRGEGIVLPEPELHPEYGHGYVPPAARYNPENARANAVLVPGLSFTGAAEGALEGLLRDLVDAGVQPVLVEMPVFRRAFFEYVPGGRDGLIEFRRLLARLAARNGVPLVQMRDQAVVREHFLDMLHLSSAGIEAASAYLAAELDAIVAGLPAGGPCEERS